MKHDKVHILGNIAFILSGDSLCTRMFLIFHRHLGPTDLEQTSRSMLWSNKTTVGHYTFTNPLNIFLSTVFYWKRYKCICCYFMVRNAKIKLHVVHWLQLQKNAKRQGKGVSPLCKSIEIYKIYHIKPTYLTDN